MDSYHLCFTWNWEYDVDFAKLLEVACRSHGLLILQITPDNLVNVLQSLVNSQISSQTFFDRASDTDMRFIPLVRWACNHILHHINSNELACRARNKVDMHQAISVFMQTPHTIILPSYDEQPILPAIDIDSLDASFSIKPALGGGGDGVIIKATSLNQVLVTRKEYPNQKYLLQAHIVPAQLGSRPAWFRIIYCAGQMYPCWWDMHTHIYTPVSSFEESCYNLGPLRSITASIARICELELFSTEIAFTPDGHFVIVDYVNDPIDLRLQSKAFDGVPDDIINNIVERLVEVVLTHCRSTQGKNLSLDIGYRDRDQ